MKGRVVHRTRCHARVCDLLVAIRELVGRQEDGEGSAEGRRKWGGL